MSNKTLLIALLLISLILMPNFVSAILLFLFTIFISPEIGIIFALLFDAAYLESYKFYFVFVSLAGVIFIFITSRIKI